MSILSNAYCHEVGAIDIMQLHMLFNEIKKSNPSTMS